MSESNRPLSPHLSIYRLPLLAWLSITHRVTGVCLSIGLVLVPVILLALASGPEGYAMVNQHLCAWYGKLFLFLFSLGLNFHLLNGIRHLFWDAGLNLGVSDAERSAHALFVVLAVLQAVLWIWVV